MQHDRHKGKQATATQQLYSNSSPSANYPIALHTLCHMCDVVSVCCVCGYTRCHVNETELLEKKIPFEVKFPVNTDDDDGFWSFSSCNLCWRFRLAIELCDFTKQKPFSWSHQRSVCRQASITWRAREKKVVCVREQHKIPNNCNQYFVFACKLLTDADDVVKCDRRSQTSIHYVRWKRWKRNMIVGACVQMVVFSFSWMKY